jgi:hypothetical protein
VIKDVSCVQDMLGSSFSGTLAVMSEGVHNCSQFLDANIKF